MARFGFGFVALLAVLAYAVADDEAKLQIIKRETLLAASAIRRIQVKTPESKVQIASMASDFISSLYYCLYTLNNVIPNVKPEDGYNELIVFAKNIADTANDMQQVLSKDVGKVQEKLISLLEYINGVVSKPETVLKVSNEYVNFQLNRKHDFLIFALYKLKYQATLFEKSNKDLQSDLVQSVAKLNGTLSNLATSNYKNSADVIRHTLQHLEAVTGRCVYMLQNWAEINYNLADEVKIVEDVFIIFSELFVEAVKAATGKQSADYMKTQLAHIFGVGTKHVIPMTEISYPENTGGLEFIRSCIFDGITIGNSYSENILGSLKP